MIIAIVLIIPSGTGVAVARLIDEAHVKQPVVVHHLLIHIARVTIATLRPVESDRPEDHREVEVIVQAENALPLGILTADIIINLNCGNLPPSSTEHFILSRHPSSSPCFLFPFYLYFPQRTKQKYQTVSRTHLSLAFLCSVCQEHRPIA